MENSRFVYNVAAILAIAPFYNFKERALLRPGLGRVYAIAITILFTYGRFFFYYSEFRHSAKTWAFTKLFLSVLDELILVLMYCFHMFVSCALKQNLWSRMNNTLLSLDGALKKMSGSKRSQEPAGPFVLRHLTFCAYHSFYFALTLYMGATATPQEAVLFVWYKWTLHPSFLIALMIHYFSHSFASKYKDLNSLLLEILSKQNAASTAKNLKLLKKYFRVLQETVGTFNELFGYPLLFTVAKFVAFSIRMLEVFIIRRNKLDGGVLTRYQDLYVRVGLAIAVTLGYTVIMVMSCDWVRAEQQQSRRICDRLEERFEEFPVMRLEVEELAEFLRDNPAEVTAADFFVVDRTTIFGMFSIIVTYLIVILQFNQLYY